MTKLCPFLNGPCIEHECMMWRADLVKASQGYRHMRTTKDRCIEPEDRVDNIGRWVWVSGDVEYDYDEKVLKPGRKTIFGNTATHVSATPIPGTERLVHYWGWTHGGRCALNDKDC